MKRLFLAAILAVAVSASAQVTFDFGLANNIRASSTVTTAYMVTNTVGTNVTYGVGVTNAVADISLWQNWSGMLAFTPLASNAGTETLTVNLARSMDNVTWETTPGIAFLTTTPASTAAVALYTNLATFIGPAPYVKLVSVVNAATNALTNVSFKISAKRER